jgi:hypothetical protein
MVSYSGWKLLIIHKIITIACQPFQYVLHDVWHLFLEINYKFGIVA